jgi:hypothetical protein
MGDAKKAVAIAGTADDVGFGLGLNSRAKNLSSTSTERETAET